jgi:hypothetical protein
LLEVPRGEQKRLLELEMFKQSLGIQSLLMQLEEKQLHLLDTIKRMANIRMLRRVLGLKLKETGAQEN